MLEESVARLLAGLAERLTKDDLDKSDLVTRLVSISSVAVRLESELSQKQREIDKLEDQLHAIALLSDEDRDRYELVSLSDFLNASAYAYAKGGERDNGPWLCAQCFELGRKSFLQPVGRAKNPHYLAPHRCNVCGSEVGES